MLEVCGLRFRAGSSGSGCLNWRQYMHTYKVSTELMPHVGFGFMPVLCCRDLRFRAWDCNENTRTEQPRNPKH